MYISLRPRYERDNERHLARLATLRLCLTHACTHARTYVSTHTRSHTYTFTVSLDVHIFQSRPAPPLFTDSSRVRQSHSAAGLITALWGFWLPAGRIQNRGRDASTSYAPFLFLGDTITDASVDESTAMYVRANARTIPATVSLRAVILACSSRNLGKSTHAQLG